MPDAELPFQPPPAGSASFRTTQWSLVLAAQGKADGEARQPLELLCRQYWPPLCAYVRHRGFSEHDAQDMTQAFFAKLLEKDWLATADRRRGRFRTFLLTALKRFIANEWDHTQAKKRGGGVLHVSLDTEGQASIAERKDLSAEAVFERRWALTVFESVLARLRGEYEAVGRLAAYERLKPQLTAERGSIDYDALAAELKIEPASARSAVHRLRKRFRGLFREEVAATVIDPADVEDEIRSLIASLGSA